MKKYTSFLIVSLLILNVSFIARTTAQTTSSGCPAPLELKDTGGGVVCQMVYTDVSQLLPGCTDPRMSDSARLDYANNVRSVECQPQSGYSIALPGDILPDGSFRPCDSSSPTCVNVGWIMTSSGWKWNGGTGAFSSSYGAPLPQPTGPTPSQLDDNRCASTQALASGNTVYTGTSSAGTLVPMDVNLNQREGCIAYAGMKSCGIDTNNPAFDPKFDPSTCCAYGVDPSIQAGGTITGCGGPVGGSGGSTFNPVTECLYSYDGATLQCLDKMPASLGTMIPGQGFCPSSSTYNSSKGQCICPNGVSLTKKSDTCSSVAANIIFGDPIIFSSKFEVGQRVRTNTNTNVRSDAYVTGTLLGAQTKGAEGTIVSGGTSFDGRYWWNINYDKGVDGWSAEDYLDHIGGVATTLLSTQSIPSKECTLGALFSSITGKPCSTSTLSNDCATGDLFSSVSGKPCTNGGIGATSSVPSNSKQLTVTGTNIKEIYVGAGTPSIVYIYFTEVRPTQAEQGYSYFIRFQKSQDDPNAKFIQVTPASTSKGFLVSGEIPTSFSSSGEYNIALISATPDLKYLGSVMGSGQVGSSY